MFTSPRDLEGVPLEEAQERWYNELEFRALGGPGPTEEVPVVEALGRVTSRAVVARRASPHYYAAAVDGLAVKSTITFGATPSTPVRVKLGADGTFVDTGSPLPQGMDTVVPLTEVQFIDVEEVGIQRPSAPWRHVSPIGEDMAVAEVIVPAHRRIRAQDVAAMVRGGVVRVSVRRAPRVGIVPVGSNLVPFGGEPGMGQRMETNTIILASLCRGLGASPVVLDIVPERLEQLREAVSGRLDEFDILVIVAGRSHGTALPAGWVADVGSLVVFGANIKPGHSVALGVVGTVPVLVLPGNAVSAYITCDLFVRPLILRYLALTDEAPVKISAVLGQQISSPEGTDEFLRVAVAEVNGKRVAVPVSRGADIVTSLVRASGFLQVPADVEGWADGSPVEVRLLDPRMRYDTSIMAMGTYDIGFDLLRNAISRRYPDINFHTANVGSQAGLAALGKGFAHVTGLHLFDDASGTFNQVFVRETMPDVPMVLVNFFQRYMGFIVKKGNPRNIVAFDDLLRADVTFVNRQHGSGTRMLIDHHLRKCGVDTARIRGYHQESHTHMSVAATVASGAADVGVGIGTVARALGLDFVPVFLEQLDLAMPRRHLKSFPIQCMLDVLRSKEFKSELEVNAHYVTELTGKVVYEGGGA